MLKQRLVPALLLVVPATAALSAGSDTIQTAEECRAAPGLAAPAGSRWHYRVNRADHRRCWFLSSGGIGGASRQARAGSPRHRHPIDNITGALQQDRQGASDLQTSSAQPEQTDTALPPTAQVTVPEVAAPSVAPSSDYLIPHSVSTVTYRQPPNSVQTGLAEKVGAVRSAERASMVESKFSIVLVAGAAAAGLLFAGGVFHFTRRVRRRSRTRAIAHRLSGYRVPFDRTASLAATLVPVTTEAVGGLTQNVRALRRGLRSSSTADKLLGSRQRSSDAIVLPPAATWLKPGTSQAD